MEFKEAVLKCKEAHNIDKDEAVIYYTMYKDIIMAGKDRNGRLMAISMMDNKEIINGTRDT